LISSLHHTCRPAADNKGTPTTPHHTTPHDRSIPSDTAPRHSPPYPSNVPQAGREPLLLLLLLWLLLLTTLQLL
jgi:hypothetical protein